MAMPWKMVLTVFFDLGWGLGCAYDVAGQDGADQCVDCGFEVGVRADFTAFDASLEDC